MIILTEVISKNGREGRHRPYPVKRPQLIKPQGLQATKYSNYNTVDYEDQERWKL
ncbi:MAG: hypothetical protein KDD70_11435 [Bdellovibrionales bacterium]|nr:hypothetical protein [Bdellovibrionales bacterium]